MPASREHPGQESHGPPGGKRWGESMREKRSHRVLRNARGRRLIKTWKSAAKKIIPLSDPRLSGAVGSFFSLQRAFLVNLWRHCASGFNKNGQEELISSRKKKMIKNNTAHQSSIVARKKMNSRIFGIRGASLDGQCEVHVPRIVRP